MNNDVSGEHDSPGYLYLQRQSSATPPTTPADFIYNHTFGLNGVGETDNVSFYGDLVTDPITIANGAILYIFGLFRARSGTPGGDVIMSDTVHFTFAESVTVTDLQTVTNTTLTV